MRRISLALLSGLVLVSVGSPAAADRPAPEPSAMVSVTLGEQLREKAVSTYGLAEMEALADELEGEVARELARTGVMLGGRVELVLEDAKPNRPTRKEMSDRPGLSFRSFSVGGASIRGRTVSFDGKVTPVRFDWYATDIADARHGAVWADAERTFDSFARRLSRGELYALR